MYLKHDLVVLAIALVWFYLGIRHLRRVPLLHDPMVAFSRYHPRVAPLVALLLIVFWPVSRWIWRAVYFCTFSRKKSK
jgi:hypothetical protein